MRQRQDTDLFGKKPERSLSDRRRAAESKLGRRATRALVALGILIPVGGAALTVREIVKGGNKTPIAQIDKFRIDTDGIPRNPHEPTLEEKLPEQYQMGTQRATLDGVITVAPMTLPKVSQRDGTALPRRMPSKPRGLAPYKPTDSGKTLS